MLSLILAVAAPLFAQTAPIRIPPLVLNCLNPQTTSPGNITPFYAVLTPGTVPGLVQCQSLLLDSSVMVIRTAGATVVTSVPVVVPAEPTAVAWLDFTALSPAPVDGSEIYCLATPITSKVRPTMIVYDIAPADSSQSYSEFWLLPPGGPVAASTSRAEWIPFSPACGGTASVHFFTGSLAAGDKRSGVQVLANF